MRPKKTFEASRKAFERAKLSIPGGVNSPVRAFKSVGMEPPFIARANGAFVWDLDENKYVDFVGSWGPAILGHAHPDVLKAVKERADLGLSFGAPTDSESDLAELILGALPGMDKIRFVSSGTEACMSAIRLARAFTGRQKIIKFTGCYHGHADSLLVKAGSGVATFGLPDSPGVPEDTAKHTISLPFNDVECFLQTVASNQNEVAAVIVEPFVGNSGFIRGENKFLQTLRNASSEHGMLLIFDEVMTGFRVAWGGVQSLVGITPDITTLGKVIGGGLPLAAFCGKEEVMELLAPEGPVYQAGTLSGNPLAATCGLKTLELLKANENTYKILNKFSQQLTSGFKQAAEEVDVRLHTDFEGGMFGFFFSDSAVMNFTEAKSSRTDLFRRFFSEMLNRGIYLAPSPFEAGFVSTAHTSDLIDAAIDAAKISFQLAKG